MSFQIAEIRALEILDSRGRPTIKATCRLADGATGSASVPAGASAGKAEALERRDGDPSRYQGLGCRQAIDGIHTEIQPALNSRWFEDQEALDRFLIVLDGTPNKARLGGNAILAISLAFARAAAQSGRGPLFEYFGRLLGQPPGRLPRPTINLFSGGKHAGAQVAIQDVLVVPMAASTMAEALAGTYAVYQAAAQLSQQRYGMRLLKADEGGLAPPFASVESMLSDAVESIERAGFKPGIDFALAIDVAASHFYRDGFYQVGKLALSSAGMIELLESWMKRFPIVSIEDGLSEEDWAHWPAWCARAADRVLVLGDDLLCTNPARIRRAIETRAANALLLKVNQIGTLTEAAEACRIARDAGWQITVSARSGETEDDWLADLAVGWSGHQIKIGSIAQSDRLAKYNRLLEIEALTSWPLRPWPTSKGH